MKIICLNCGRRVNVKMGEGYMPTAKCKRCGQDHYIEIDPKTGNLKAYKANKDDSN